MTWVTVQTLLNDAPVNGLAADPEISIVRVSDDSVVVNADAMTDVGAGGLYKYQYTGGAPGEEFNFFVDADPGATGQVDTRNYFGSFDNEIRDLWNDHGLNPVENKTITENAANVNYDEAVTDADGPNVAKSVVKSGSVTTIDRA